MARPRLEWVGGLLAKGLLDFEIQIENKDFEATIEINQASRPARLEAVMFSPSRSRGFSL